MMAACSRNNDAPSNSNISSSVESDSSQSISQSQPLEVGVALAKRSYEMASSLAPIVYTQNGTVGMDQLIYGRSIDLPLSNLLSEWPVGGTPEEQVWGDLLYCRDALLTLHLNSMAGFNRAVPPSGEDKKRFNNSLEACNKALSG